MIMQISSISPLPPGYSCPKIKQPFSAHLNPHIRKPTTSLLYSSLDQHPQYRTNPPPVITTEFSRGNLQEDRNTFYAHNNLFLDEMVSFLGENNNSKKPQILESPLERDSEVGEKIVHRGISSNMWWQTLKATLGQRFNLEGISTAVSVITREQSLAIPHLSVKDIRWIDWMELEKRGFKGVVFDKDNTLTVPYSLSLWGPLELSLDSCKSVFGDNVAVFSNSAGLHQYDADGSKARAIEDSIGVQVIRHGVKKPGGSAEDIEKYFGCPASLLIMVGDRNFTDMVYGNRNGFLTILTEPLSLVEEPFVVKQVRKLESSLANYWQRRGVKPECHSLLSGAIQCVKVPPPP